MFDSIPELGKCLAPAFNTKAPGVDSVLGCTRKGGPSLLRSTPRQHPDRLT
jgi:hypothetical protein